MRSFFRVVFAVMLGMYAIGGFSGKVHAKLFESVSGRQFVIAGVSTGEIPVFNEVLIFNEDGSFVMKKMENYGDGEYFEFINGFFYFIFNNRSGIDIQFAEATGFSVPSVFGQMIIGFGSFMIDYNLAPTAFIGIEVF